MGKSFQQDAVALVAWLFDMLQGQGEGSSK